MPNDAYVCLPLDRREPEHGSFHWLVYTGDTPGGRLLPARWDRGGEWHSIGGHLFNARHGFHRDKYYYLCPALVPELPRPAVPAPEAAT